MMAAESVAISSSQGSPRPYARSWLDVVFDWITAQPGPTWVPYALLVVPSILLAQSALWLSGLRPVGDFDAQQVFWGVATVGIVAATHYLRSVAGSAFDAFRPALGTGVADPDRARYELTVMPARTIVVVTLLNVALTPPYYLSDPEATQTVGLTGIGLLARAASEIVIGIAVLAIVVQAIRQMRQVSHLHRVANAVDPFRPSPLHAFSRLTAQIGIVLIVFNVLGIAVVAYAGVSFEALSGLFAYFAWVATTMVVAVVVFVVPLLGMRSRLAAEKDRLESAAGSRMRALLGELNEAIDARASDRVDALDRTISALRHEREVLAKLPTWPWSTGTIRGFGSALLLPIALFLVQRALSAALGE